MKPSPMTFCLTFDDGLLSHARVAAPMLEAFGWHGVFSVPTEIVTSRTLTPRQAEDMCLVGNEWNVMSWDDVRTLLAHGHVVCPHTCSHADLLDLERSGRMDAVEAEVAESKRQFAQMTGVTPTLFCLPHCSGGPAVSEIVRRHGMEPINGAGKWRVNFGEASSDGQSYSDITSFLRRFYWLGFRHVDVMVHGVVRAEGGWRPFEDAAAFRRFLEAIRAEESAGRVRVVDYAEGHLRPPRSAVREFAFKFYRRLCGAEVPEI